VVYGVSGHYLFRWDGTEGSEESGHAGYNISVWADAEDDVWTCGWPGSGAPRHIYHYDGGSWAQEYSIDWTMPWDVWSDGTYVYAVWDDGIVSVYDGSAWSHSTVTSPPVTLRAVWGVSATDVFVAGAGGTVYRLQGAVWSEMTTGVGAGIELSDIWGTSATDVLAVGEAGTIIRYDGTSWTAETGGVSSVLTAIWADGPNNYWVTSMSGDVLHYDGNSWSQVPSGLTSEFGLNCIWGSGGNDVWVGGDSDFLLHYEQR
jgi:hypothetical protein